MVRLALAGTAVSTGPTGASSRNCRARQNVLVEASGLTEAQVRFAAQAELARCVEDVLARRNRALFLDAAAARRAAPEVARVMAEVLGFSERVAGGAGGEV